MMTEDEVRRLGAQVLAVGVNLAVVSAVGGMFGIPRAVAVVVGATAMLTATDPHAPATVRQVAGVISMPGAVASQAVFGRMWLSGGGR